MKLNDIISTSKTLSLVQLAADSELVKDIQQVLISKFSLIEPPVDGAFGPMTKQALLQFQEATRCADIGTLDAETATKLLRTDAKEFLGLKLTNDLPSRVVGYMLSKGYYLSTGKGRFNIVYLEGVDANGKPNGDAPNVFNDQRMVIEIVDGQPRIVGQWECTTEPGFMHTQNPPNPMGVARIALDQFKAWTVGIHTGGSGTLHQESLVQDGIVKVHRDGNKDGFRNGDFVDIGTGFGINQHHAEDAPHNDIGGWSAGCLVGRSRSEHETFMKIVKSDARYLADRNYWFISTVLDGDALAAFSNAEEKPQDTPIGQLEVTWFNIFRNDEGKTILVGMNADKPVRKWAPQDKNEFIAVLEKATKASSVPLVAPKDRVIPQV